VRAVLTAQQAWQGTATELLAAADGTLASSMPIRAGLLTLKMTPSFIRAHGTGLPAALALSGGGARGGQESPDTAKVTPIVIAPWGRNGSTLVMSILTSAPEIFGPPDYTYDAYERYQLLHFFRAAEVLAGRSAAVSVSQAVLMASKEGAPPINELPFLVGNADDLVSTLLVSLWDGYVAHLRRAGLITPQKKFYAEKGTVDLVAAIARKRPVYCIYVKRDPRDLLASSKAFNEARGKFDYGWSDREDSRSIVGRLIKETTYCLDVLDRLPPSAIKITLRYEDLITNQEQSVECIARQLGTRLSAALARSIPRDHKTSSSDHDSIGRWRSDLPRALKDEIERSAGGLLARLGYGESTFP
jgi:hypothetical protein